MPGKVEDVPLERGVVERVKNAALAQLGSGSLKPGDDALGGPAATQQRDQSRDHYQAPAWLHGSGAGKSALDRALARAEQRRQLATTHTGQSLLKFAEEHPCVVFPGGLLVQRVAHDM